MANCVAEVLLEQIVIASRENGEALELEVEIPSKWNRRGWANVELRVPHEMNV